MRTLSFAVAACFALCVGGASAQHYNPYSTPSQLYYPAYGAAYMQPKAPMPPEMPPKMAKPEPLPLSDAPQAHPEHHGAVIHEGCGCESSSNGCSDCGSSSCGCDCGCGCDSCCGWGGGWFGPGCGLGGGFLGGGGMVGGGSAYFGGGGVAGRGCCWFGSVSGLIMSRSDNNPVWVSFDPRVVNSAILGTPEVEPNDWRGGFEVTVGRNLGCGCRVAATYWTLDPDNNSRTITDQNRQISSTLIFNNLNFTPVDPVNNWFANARAQRLRMRSEFHNVEINVLHDLPAVCVAGRAMRFSCLGGFRYFRFTEDFDFETSDNSTTFGVDRRNEARYRIDVENNLIGFQIGGRADCQATCQLGAYAETRLGIYYNDIEHETRLTNGVNQIAFDQFGNSWDINTEKDAFSTLAQLDLGLSYQVNCHWSAHVGYRLVAASGVALSTNQIPFYIADYNGIRKVDHNGHLFLHGAVAGITACY